MPLDDQQQSGPLDAGLDPLSRASFRNLSPDQIAQARALINTPRIPGQSGGPSLVPTEPSMQTYTPSFAEALKGGIQDSLMGLGADKYAARHLGEAGATLGSAFPGIGVPMAADELYRASERRDPVGALFGAIGMIPMAKGAATAAKGAASEVAPGIRAYHGSPHDFEQFSLDKIGTGEGAQAYGHGLYFAQSEGVAKSYRDALSGGITDPIVSIGGKPASRSFDDVHERVAFDRLKEAFRNGATDPAAAAIEATKNSPLLGGKQKQLDVLERWQKEGVDVKLPGKMYEVNIRADPEHFLDWDKPLSEQSRHVQDALTRVSRGGGEWSYERGENVVHRLQDVYGKEQISAKLRDAGIPGIRYLDQGSRFLPQQVDHLKNQVSQLEDLLAKTPKSDPKYDSISNALTGRRSELAQAQPTRNYVAFDDSIIDIIKKYGIAGLMGGAAAYGALGSSKAKAGEADGGAIRGYADGGAPTLTSVDHDPFATGPSTGATLTPVDHDPFTEASRPVHETTTGSLAKQGIVGAGEGLLDTGTSLYDAPTSPLYGPGMVGAFALSKLSGVEPKKWIGPGATPMGDVYRGILGKVGLNPEQYPAESTSEKYAREIGKGAGAMAIPMGGARRAAQVAGDLVIGGIGGATGEAASEMVPEKYAPWARLAGNIVGGGGAAILGEGTKALARGTASGVRDFTAPLTETGQQRLAAQTIADRATDFPAVRRSIEQPNEMVPGSQPTVFQASGDMGLGSLEREVATRDPAAFMQLRSEQNAARVSALRAIQENGSPQAVPELLRANLTEIDTRTQQAIDAALAEAQTRAQAVGGTLRPDEYGGLMRTALRDAEEAARAGERRLWSAVDPDGTLAIGTAPIQRAAETVYGELSQAGQAGLSGVESQILGVIEGYRGVEPFREMTDLRSLISTAMRQELVSSGRTPTYARLAQLRGAVEGSINGTVSGQAMREAQAVAAGTLAQNETVAANLQRVAGDRFDISRSEGGGPTMGTAVPNMGTHRVTAADGTAVDVAPTVVEASTVRTSADAGYDSALQPRQRDRAASQAQIRNIAANPIPERLGYSAEADRGAPIVGPDGMIESGNGRVLALRQMYERGGPQADAYRQWLATQGVDVTGFREPVLVRERVTPLTDDQRRAFTVSSNQAATLAMSAPERAVADARSLNSDTLGLIRNTTDLASPANREFARRFVGTLPQSERGMMMDAAGNLSAEGLVRIRNAVLARAYGDANVLTRIAESTNDEVRSISSALTSSAPEWARMRAEIAAGRVRADIDMTPALVEAVSRTADIRARGGNLESFLAQQDAFDRLPTQVEAFMRIFYDPNGQRAASSNRISDALRFYAEEGAKVSNEPGLNLGMVPVQGSDIARLAVERHRASYGSEAGISERGGLSDGARGAEGRGEVRGPGVGASREGIEGGRAQGNQGAAANARRPFTRERPEESLTPNFDEAARQRLNEATAATRERAQTYGAQPIRGVLRREGQQGPFVTPAGMVPSRIFRPGEGGRDAVETYRRAVAGDATAMATLGDYAASDMRRAAMRPDGTIDPARLTRWQNQHAEALRAFPQLQQQFANAATATETLGNLAAARRRATDAYDSGAIGRLLDLQHGADVVKTVGSILGSRDAVGAMRQLATEARRNPAAMEGLRKAAADHIIDRFIGNTEAGTSGQSLIKADAFQTFMRQNGDALAQIFTPAEIASMRNVAADIQRANRSRDAVKLPGQSNTAQDTAALARSGPRVSLLSRILTYVGAIGTDLALTGGLGSLTHGIAGAVGAGTLNKFRDAGIKNVEQIIRDAMLDPARMRLLLERLPPERSASYQRVLANRLQRLATMSAATSGAMIQRQTGGRVIASHIDRNPTEAQKASGNYRKAHVTVHGLDISIENAKGHERSGIGRDGKTWRVTMPAHYGYIKRTEGADGDHVDVYLGPDLASDRVFIVDQIDAETRKFDEHKVMMGFRSKGHALSTYKRAFSDGRGHRRIGHVREMSVEQFKDWLRNGDTMKPAKAA